MAAEPLILDSVTHLTAEHRGRAVHCASHGGTYAGYYAAKMGIGAVILNDAGIGRERAGLGGVLLLEALGVPAAAISHRTARIGDGADGVARGRLSFVNAPAARIGLGAGMACREALDLLGSARLMPSPAPSATAEHRHVMAAAGRPGVDVVAMDSISLVEAADAGLIVVTASHGGLLGGKPASAIKHPVFAVVCNDADRGIDDAGVSRLPALDARAIAGGCVSAFSARIGDGMSTYADGFISAVNGTAQRRGGVVGQSCKDFVAAMVAARARELAGKAT